MAKSTTPKSVRDLQAQIHMWKKQVQSCQMSYDELLRLRDEDLRQLQQSRQEIAGRDAALAEVQHQLAVSERERTLAEERLEMLQVTVLAQSRFMSELQSTSEELRYPEPKRG